MVPRDCARRSVDDPHWVAPRRGVVLILVLGMIGLLALVGTTFVAISSQVRINARNFADSLLRPDPKDLMFFAISQLIGDASNPLSAIRVHSLLRDMYGNDASSNGSLTARPGGRSTG